jgi:hypothetical protein
MRTILGKAVLERYHAVLTDLGGEENLTTLSAPSYAGSPGSK